MLRYNTLATFLLVFLDMICSDPGSDRFSWPWRKTMGSSIMNYMNRVNACSEKILHEPRSPGWEMMNGRLLWGIFEGGIIKWSGGISTVCHIWGFIGLSSRLSPLWRHKNYRNCPIQLPSLLPTFGAFGKVDGKYLSVDFLRKKYWKTFGLTTLKFLLCWVGFLFCRSFPYCDTCNMTFFKTHCQSPKLLKPRLT